VFFSYSTVSFSHSRSYSIVWGGQREKERWLAADFGPMSGREWEQAPLGTGGREGDAQKHVSGKCRTHTFLGKEASVFLSARMSKYN
jgi:hypothetical protein